MSGASEISVRLMNYQKANFSLQRTERFPDTVEFPKTLLVVHMYCPSLDRKAGVRVSVLVTWFPLTVCVISTPAVEDSSCC